MLAERRGLSLGSLRLAAVALAAIHLYLVIAAEPLGDEAYYWLWGQHPALSYYDHPPLNGWLLGLAGAVFGWTTLGLRFWTWVSMAAVLALFADWSRRLAPGDAERTFWAMVAAYYASPLFTFMTGLALPDHLLVPLCLWSAHCFVLYFETRAAGRERLVLLYAGAVLLGFAGLTKYNALFFGLAVAAFVVVDPVRRRELGRSHLWLAGALALGMQAPALLWNLGHGLASYRYHLVERQSAELLIGRDVVEFLDSIGATLLFGSPTLVWPLLVFLVMRPGTGFAGAAATLGRFAAVVSSSVMVVIAAVSGVGIYWNIVAYIGFMPFAPLLLRMGRLLALHLALGVVLCGALVVNFAVAPLGTLLGFRPSLEDRMAYGFAEAAAAVDRARAASGAGFVAATRYTMAAQLAFHLRDPGVADLSERRSAFGEWFDPAAHLGDDAIVLAEPRYVSFGDAMRAQFGSVELIETVSVSRLGRFIGSFEVYLARDYRGP